MGSKDEVRTYKSWSPTRGTTYTTTIRSEKASAPSRGDGKTELAATAQAFNRHQARGLG